MSASSAVSGSAVDPSTARSEGSTSIRGKRGVELWLDESASETGSPVKSKAAPGSPKASAAAPLASAEPAAAAPRDDVSHDGTNSATPGVSPSVASGRRATSPQARPLNGLLDTPSASPGTSARGPGDDAAVADQLRLLKEKRKSRSTRSDQDSDAQSARPSTNDSMNATGDAIMPPAVMAGRDIPPLPLAGVNKSAPTSSRNRTSAGSAAGKPPLSGRRGVATTNQTVHLRKRTASSPGDSAGDGGAMSSRGAPPSLSIADIAKKINDLQSADWKVVSDALESLRAILTASASLQDPVRVVMRQNLHALVTGTLAAMDSARSTLAKFATDMLGLVCQKLGTRHLELDEEEAAAAVGGNSNSLDHFVEPIVNRIITKGGAASSRFLYDGACVALRELVPATKPLKVLMALNAMSGIKTDKSKVLHAEGLSSAFEALNPHALRGKTDVIVKAIDSADHYVHDAHPDVREAGKKLCRSVATYCSESKENLRALVSKTIGSSQPTRARETLAFCVAVGSSGEELMAKPTSANREGTPSTTTASATPSRGATGDDGAAGKATPAAPKSGRRAAGTAADAAPSANATPQPATKPASSREATPSRVAAEGGRKKLSSKPGDAKPAAAPSTTPPNQMLLPDAKSPNPVVSPIVAGQPGSIGASVRNDSFRLDEAMLPGRRETSPTMQPASTMASPRGPNLGSPQVTAATPLAGGPASPRGGAATTSPRLGSLDATQTNNSLFSANTSFFTGTISRDMQHEHGEFSHGIFAAAEGTSADRLKALDGLTALLRKRQHDEEIKKFPIANATCFALCDVIALRCADTSQKVQVAALQLVPILFSVVQPAVIDSTSPRWVSCLSSALASSFTAVHAAAVIAVKSLMGSSTEANLRNLCQTICMSCSTVRNINTKVELLEALGIILRRHNHIATRDMGGDTSLPTSPSLASSGAGRLGLTKLDLEFCTETGLRIWCADRREEVRRVAGQYLLTVVTFAWDGDESMVLDNKRLDSENWALIKALIDRSRAPPA